MQHTLIVTLSNRAPVPEFDQTIALLRQLGAQYQLCPGWSDVSQGRSAALSAACYYLRKNGWPTLPTPGAGLPERDMVLLMDDDMAINPGDVQLLVDSARASGVACSAVYAAADANVKEQRGSLAGCKLEGKPGRWTMGLGCIAIPASLLLELELQSEKFEMRGQQFSEFTWSCAENGRWIAEDYRLCLRLGGVRLLPIQAGHKKAILLWPDDETLAEVAREDQLWEP